jgi:arabinogalactan oligomer / maltooligosaccharide transport system substrate-binding protein
MKKKNCLILSLLALSALASCGASGDSSGVTLTIWEDASNIETLQEIGKEFVAYHKQTYPSEASITIDFEPKGEAAAVSDLTTIGESGNGPDIAAITSDTLATAVKSKLVAPATYSEDVRRNFDSKAVTNVTIEDTVYAYPITAESQVIMYDKSQVSDATIFDDFDKLLASGKKLGWDVNQDNCAYYMFGFCNDSVLFGDEGTDASKLDLATTQSVANYVAAMNTYQSVFVPSSTQDAASLISAKTAVGLVSSPFMYSSLSELLGSANVGMHILPKINGKDMRPFSGYKEYVVSSYSKHPSLAQEFADYLVSADAQMWRLSKKNYLPTRHSDDIDKEIAASAIDTVYQSSYEKSIPMSTIEAMGNFWNPMIQFCKKMWESKGSVTTASVTAGLQEVVSAMKAS